jgi:hypothetical protein
VGYRVTVDSVGLDALRDVLPEQRDSVRLQEEARLPVADLSSVICLVPQACEAARLPMIVK